MYSAIIGVQVLLCFPAAANRYYYSTSTDAFCTSCHHTLSVVNINSLSTEIKGISTYEYILIQKKMSKQKLASEAGVGTKRLGSYEACFKFFSKKSNQSSVSGAALVRDAVEHENMVSLKSTNDVAVFHQAPPTKRSDQITKHTDILLITFLYLAMPTLLGIILYWIFKD